MKELVKNMGYSYFGTVTKKIVIDKLMEMYLSDEVFILDVRSEEENENISFPFAKNIPLHKLPKRLNELPKDKTIAVFCSQATKATMAYTYLVQEGFDVKLVLENIMNFKNSFRGETLNPTN